MLAQNGSALELTQSMGADVTNVGLAPDTIRVTEQTPDLLDLDIGNQIEV